MYIIRFDSLYALLYYSATIIHSRTVSQPAPAPTLALIPHFPQSPSARNRAHRSPSYSSNRAAINAPTASALSRLLDFRFSSDERFAISRRNVPFFCLLPAQKAVIDYIPLEKGIVRVFSSARGHGDAKRRYSRICYGGADGRWPRIGSAKSSGIPRR